MTRISNELAITQEISSLESQMRYAIELREKISEATEQLKKGYFGLIYSKEEFERVKKQNVEEIRSYKFAIAAEVKEIDRLESSISKSRIEQMKEFVTVCERMQSLKNQGFFSTFKIESP